MKVLGLFGSPRRGGNTDILLEELLKSAEREGAKVERIYLSELRITPCKECHGCDATGSCVILDDMEKICPQLAQADVIVLASPIFFYGVTGWAKALIDRSQSLWAKKYLLKNPSTGEGGKRRKGFFISVGATKGRRLFEGAILTVKYFFDALNVEYAGELLWRGVDGKGEILKHPEALEEAREAGRRLVLDV